MINKNIDPRWFVDTEKNIAKSCVLCSEDAAEDVVGECARILLISAKKLFIKPSIFKWEVKRNISPYPTSTYTAVLLEINFNGWMV